LNTRVGIASLKLLERGVRLRHILKTTKILCDYARESIKSGELMQNDRYLNRHGSGL